MIAASQAAFDPDVEEVLLRVYGVDSHSITLRRLMVLLHRLPQGSWKKDQTAASWSEEAYLLANVVDAVNQVAWITAQVASGKKKVSQPKPVDRPGMKRKEKVSWSQFTDQMSGVEGVIVDG
jgi:hypothetical protein